MSQSNHLLCRIVSTSMFSTMSYLWEGHVSYLSLSSHPPVQCWAQFKLVSVCHQATESLYFVVRKKDRERKARKEESLRDKARGKQERSLTPEAAQLFLSRLSPLESTVHLGRGSALPGAGPAGSAQPPLHLSWQHPSEQ